MSNFAEQTHIIIVICMTKRLIIKQLEMRTNILEESLRVQKNTVASHTERITELETEISLYKEIIS